MQPSNAISSLVARPSYPSYVRGAGERSIRYITPRWTDKAVHLSLWGRSDRRAVPPYKVRQNCCG